jgi:hypothetical protein
VTAGRTGWPFGESTARRRQTLTHMPHTILFAWRAGGLAGRMMAWQCGARTAYFRLLREPAGKVCQMCVFQSRGRMAE